MSEAWLSKKYLKELELRKEDVKDTLLAGCKDHAQYEYLRGRYSSLADAENIFRALLGRVIQNDIEATGT